MLKKKYIKRIIAIFLIVLIGFMIWGNVTMRVSHYNIIDNNIPKEFSNYKIVQISDFHNIKTKDKLIKSIKNENPNIIVITGDLIDSYKTNVNRAVEFINKIIDIAPIYYINGNHESRIIGYVELKKQLEKLSVNVLDNKMIRLEYKGAFIDLFGISDPEFSTNLYMSNTEKIDMVLKKFDFSINSYKILLSHRPELLDVYASYPINLVFSGHAHGGQFRLPFIGGLYAPDQGLFPKYTTGIYELNNTKMVVSRGLGNSIIPIRFNNRPEIVIVTLNKK